MLAQQKQASCCTGMSQFASDPAFLAAHLSPLPLNYKPTEGHAVTWKASDGKPTTGFYVAPNKGNKVGIVLVHEWWGLNDYMKREAERLHDKTGYAVLAVDLYDGKTTTDPKQAGAMMQGLNADRATAIVKSAVPAIRGGAFGSKSSRIGTVGFCMGGGWSMQTAIQGGKNVNACVMFYGMPDTKPEALAKLKAPVLFIWGTKDGWINAKVAQDFKDAMNTAGKHLEEVSYNADHAFANPSNPNYDKSAAEDAWKHTLAFYKAKL